MPIDKPSERGEQHQADDWERIHTEWDKRSKAQRDHDATHDPSPEWEAAARPLPKDHGKDRPPVRIVTQDQIEEMIEFVGEKAVEKQLDSGRLVLTREPGSVADHAGRADRMLNEVDLGEKAQELPNARDVLPRLDWAEIPTAKFADYSMHPDHPANQGKAEGWRALGYDVHDPDARREAGRDITDLLYQDLLCEGKVARTDPLPDGAKHQVWNGFIGPNGRHATLVTGWLVTDEGERSHPKLTTTWVRPHKENEEKQQ